jgi:glycine/D-amino acid oxidase-like deaminating enzyme
MSASVRRRIVLGMMSSRKPANSCLSLQVVWTLQNRIRPRSIRRVQAYAQTGVSFDEMDRADILTRFPQFNLPKNTVGVYQQDTAILAADLCVAALAFLAKRHGAEIVEETKVEGVEPNADGVVVRAGGRRFDASTAVPCMRSKNTPF